jgi:dihydroneopterin aldolase
MESARREDRLLVEGLVFVGRHGVYAEERREGRRFRVDLEVTLGAGRSGGGDRLEETVDYRGLAQVVMDVAQGPSHQLIEALAEEMAGQILGRYPVSAVSLTLRKYADGVPGEPECVGVRIHRRAEAR